MSEKIEQLESELEQDELTLLKERATKLGIKYSNNIGLETLREKINEKIEPKENEYEGLDGLQIKALKRKEARNKALKLRRIKISNLNPANKDVPGQIYRFRNSLVGSVGKFIPFSGKDAEAWHVPQCIYNMLKSKRYLNQRDVKDPVTGRTKKITELSPEFSIIDLPPLTKEDLKRMAVEQAAAGLV